MTLGDFREATAIDFWGTVYGSLAVLPGMRRRRSGAICNITSVGGELTVPHLFVDADRAARRIVRAIARGEAYVPIGLLATLARQARALAPGLTARLLAQLGRLMPPPGDGPVARTPIRGTTLSIH